MPPEQDYFKQFSDVSEDYFAQFPVLEEPVKKKVENKERGMLGKAWDWANSSLIKGSFIDPKGELTSPTIEEWQSNPVRSAQRFAGTAMTSPLGLASEAVGGLSLLRGLRSVPKTAAPIKGQGLLKAGAYEVTPEGTVRGQREVLSAREQLTGKPLPSNRNIKPYAPAKKEQKLLPAANYEVTPEGVVRGKTETTPLRTLLNPDDIIDVKPTRVEEIFNPSGKMDEIKITEQNPAKMKVTETEASAYIDAVNTGKIPKGTTFAQFKDSLSRLAKEETGALRISSPKEALPKGVTRKQFDRIQTDVINALRSGDLINLNQLAHNSGLPRKTFDKLVDKVIESGALKNIKKASESQQNQSVVKLLHALDVSKPLREQQEAIYSAERSKRFAAFEGVKETGRAGFDKSLSQLSGEMPKVAPVQLNDVEVDNLFNMIKNARILPGEKAHAGTGLKKLLDGTGLPQRSELALLDKVFGSGFAESVIQMHGGIGAVGLRLTKAANTMKSLNATMDASAPLRQGLGLVHRKEFWKSWREMYGYGASEEKFQALNKSLESRPNYLLGRENGLYLAGEELATKEEQFLTSYLGDLAEKGKFGKAITAPMRASERMYVGFLNKLRADTFDNLLSEAVKAGHDPKEIAGPLARYVNVSTGRGDLGKLAKMGEELNAVFFSPRLIASRLTVLNPKYYYDAPQFVRKEALKTLAGLASFTVLANGLGALAGSKITLDPRNSDFGKLKFGANTRLDPAGGFSQYITAAARVLSGKSVSPTSLNERTLGQGYGTPSRLSLIAGIGGQEKSFLENKMSPAASLIDVILSNRDFSGQPPDVKKEIRNRFIPIIMQDLAEIANEDPSLAWLTIPATHGMGLQVFEPRQRQTNVNPPSMN